jgi:ArsR family transcriptional regulator, arsenate/arsenite/antimonite-responsive transcriptional repressor
MKPTSTSTCCPAPADGCGTAADTCCDALPTDSELATMAKALAHPLRVRILRVLAARRSCICGDLVDLLPVAQSTVSQHLKVLKQAGLIADEVDGPRTCYCLDREAIARLEALVSKL